MESKLKPVDLYKPKDESILPEWFTSFLSHYGNLVQTFLDKQGKTAKLVSLDVIDGVSIDIPSDRKTTVPTGVCLTQGRVSIVENISISRTKVSVKCQLVSGYSSLTKWACPTVQMYGPLAAVIKIGDMVNIGDARLHVVSIPNAYDGTYVTIELSRKVSKITEGEQVTLHRTDASFLLIY